MANKKQGNGAGGNSLPQNVPHTLVKAGMDSKLFRVPSPFDIPRLSSIEILANGRASSLGNIQSNSSSSSSDATTRFMRMVDRAPEVMIKVTGGGSSTGQLKAHLEYISRNAKLQVETSEEEILQNRDEILGFVEAWEIDTRPGAGEIRQAYNIMLSMPPGTDSEQVKFAAREFARDTWGKTYPYAMVLHTDKAHPHVHICVRMTPSDRKDRKLFIRKADLEKYRQRFAEKLVERGIQAVATPREYRGVTRKGKNLAVYHAEKAGRSTISRAKMSEVVHEIRSGQRQPEPWKKRIERRRQIVLAHYANAIKELEEKGKYAQAAKVRKFVKAMPPIETEKDRYRKYVKSYFHNREEKTKLPPTKFNQVRQVQSKRVPQRKGGGRT